jgi:hypothetical protein
VATCGREGPGTYRQLAPLVDALPPRQTLEEMDAAARDMGIVSGDPAYAFYLGLRRLYADQQISFERVIEEIRAAQSAQPHFSAADIDAIGRRMIQAFRPNIGDALRAMRVRSIAIIVSIVAAFFVGGVVIGGVGVWYWLGYVPTHYVHLIPAPEKPPAR